MRPRTFFEAFAALARAAGSWAAVPPLECPDLGPLKFWPDMPWHQRADELEVDELRTAMLAEVDVPVRCRTGISPGNVRAGTPYQRVDGRPLHRVWPVRLLDGLGWRIPLPAIVARFGDPTGFLGDSQHVSIDVGRTTIHEVGALGVGWRGWQARNYRRSDYSRPFDESSSATAGGIPLLAGLARREELDAGLIEHALLISGPASGRHRWPARGSDGQHPSHPLEYGDRLVLREDVADRAPRRARRRPVPSGRRLSARLRRPPERPHRPRDRRLRQHQAHDGRRRRRRRPRAPLHLVHDPPTAPTPGGHLMSAPTPDAGGRWPETVLLARIAELEENQAPGPKARAVRTAVQALVAFLGAVPTAWAALVAAGVEVDAQVAALVVGIPAALVILVSAVWNTIDSRRGLA
jgi:hypothetical protein